ncbi:hypothetical protein [Nitrospira sp. M1]
MTKAEKKFWEEIKKASSRIGWTDESALIWLLRFAQTDVSTLSEGQWLDLKSELEVFFYCGRPSSDRDLADQDFFEYPARETERTWSPFIKQTSGVVPEIQKTLLQALQALVNEGEVRFPPIKITPIIKRESPIGKPLVLPSHGKDPHDFFLFHAIQLLEVFKKNIHACNECHRFFLGYRFQQNFCSPPCQNRVNQRKVRERRAKQGKPNKIVLKPGKLVPAKQPASLSTKGSLR